MTAIPIQRYLRRHAENCTEAESLAPPVPGLALCVVIPALMEREGLAAVIDSLGAGLQGPARAEVIVVVNNPADAPPEILRENMETIGLLQGRRWPLPVVVLDRATPGKAYPRSQAGVGVARRTGMDLALRRLVSCGAADSSAIVCLDADSPVRPGYLDAIQKVFAAPGAPLAGICSFRHPLPAEESHARAILAYELWMRYLELGFVRSRSPYAFQTVGSTLVASPLGYALADGMPRRAAAEDFYFLQKVVKVGGPGRIARLLEAVVLPSARPSFRVPFGTGRAMRRCQEEGLERYLMVEPPVAFRELGALFESVSGAYHDPDQIRRALSPELRAFFVRIGGFDTFSKLRANAGDPEHLLRAMHNWFDSLQVVRYARACRRETGGVWLFTALAEILRDLGHAELPRNLPEVQPGDPALESWIVWLDALREQEKILAQGSVWGVREMA